MAQTEQTFTLPLFVSADDYHEFGEFARLLRTLSGVEVEYEELETDRSVSYDADVALGGRPHYYAILYTGRKDSHIKGLIAQFLGHGAAPVQTRTCQDCGKPEDNHNYRHRFIPYVPGRSRTER